LRREDATGTQRELARHVWVLGASLGGPEAVKLFLAALPGDLPVAFVLAQHLGANFDGLLAQQLDRVTALQVRTSRAGHTLHHGEVIVAPVNQRLHINPLGVIELHPLAAPSFYTPSIDTVITDMARRYGRASGVIVFSGMCDDGIMGVRVMQALGGPVWAQDAESCVISAMPDNIRRTGTVSYTGAPEQLAAKLLEYLQIRLQV
jgi:chemotaxis response regulator CheB